MNSNNLQQNLGKNWKNLQVQTLSSGVNKIESNLLENTNKPNSNSTSKSGERARAKPKEIKHHKMLTLEENRWNLKAIKILSLLNLVPIKIRIGADGGRIRLQPSKIRVLIWKIFFFIWFVHSSYISLRLVQSILQPEKYFQWDHFVVHFPTVCTYVALFFHGVFLFVVNPTECVEIFNYIFVKGQNPMEKRMAMANQIKNHNHNVQVTRDEGKEKKRERKRKLFRVKLDLKPALQHHLDSDSHQRFNRVRRRSSAARSSIRIKTESDTAVRSLLSWPPKYALDELVARTLTLPAVTIVFAGTAILAIDPSRCQLLYSALPSEYQNLYSFLCLLIVEAFSLAMMLVNTYFAAFLQLMFFSKCQAEFEQLNLQLRSLKEKFQTRSRGIGMGTGMGNGGRDVDREIGILRQILKEMGEFIVFIELFNRAFPFCIFSMKQAVLSSTTFYYFFAIRHFHNFPFIAAFCTYLAVAMTLVYCVTYQHAFAIPEKTKELKAEFLLVAQKSISVSTSKAAAESGSSSTVSNGSLSKNIMKGFEREMMRIQDMGIQVGSFHQMERQSTPNFVDFVVKNVVNLLVSFPK